MSDLTHAVLEVLRHAERPVRTAVVTNTLRQEGFPFWRYHDHRDVIVRSTLRFLRDTGYAERINGKGWIA